LWGEHEMYTKDEVILKLADQIGKLNAQMEEMQKSHSEKTQQYYAFTNFTVSDFRKWLKNRK
jgi:hypothetical protein